MAASPCQRVSTKSTTIRAITEESVGVSLTRSEKPSHELR